MKNSIIKFVLVAMVILVASYSGARNYLYNDYNNDVAVEYLVEHAEPHPKNSYAMYVRRAISAGGCPSFGQPPSACDYNLFLPDLGFHEVPQEGNSPQKGDVVAFSAIMGQLAVDVNFGYGQISPDSSGTVPIFCVATCPL